MSWNIWVWIVFFSLSNALNAKPRSISPWEQQLQTVKICVTWKTAHSHCNCDLPLRMHWIAVCETDSIQSQHRLGWNPLSLVRQDCAQDTKKHGENGAHRLFRLGQGAGPVWPNSAPFGQSLATRRHTFSSWQTWFFLCQTWEWFNGKNMGMLDPDHTTYNIQNFRIIPTLIEGLVSTKKICSVVSLGFSLGCFFSWKHLFLSFFCWNR